MAPQLQSHTAEVAEVHKAVSEARGELSGLILSLTEALQMISKAKDESSGAEASGPSSGQAGNGTGRANPSSVAEPAPNAPPQPNVSGSASGAAATGGAGTTPNGGAQAVGAVANGGRLSKSTPSSEIPAAGDSPPLAEESIKKHAAKVSKHMEKLRAATTAAVAAGATRARNAESGESCVSSEEKCVLEAKRNGLRRKVTDENEKMKLLIDQLRDLHFFLHSVP